MELIAGSAELRAYSRLPQVGICDGVPSSLGVGVGGKSCSKFLASTGECLHKSICLN